jgi:hypothetical protein
MIRHALLASVLLLSLTGGQALAVTAGVTAAVNQNAKSIPPGGGVRTIVLGDNVVQNETIETDGAGLVQILLADGTTFTVGPNSSLVIDRFVYDPDANTAQVAASLGRGVFRFIGGRTSKTEGGVQLNTPVGTVGIRGGMADLNFTGTGGNVAQIDLLFGNEVTLNGPNGGDRLFQPGYSIVIGPNGQPNVIKTPPGSANFIQQALAGRPGGNGGNSQQPDDEDVANSGVPGNNSNSNQPPNIPQPDLNAIDLATPKPNDINQVAQDIIPQAPTTLDGTYNGFASAWVAPGGEVSSAEFYRNILSSDVEFEFNKSARSVSGTIYVAEEGTEPTDYLQIAFGPNNGGSSFYFNDLFYYGVGSAGDVDFGGGTPSAGGSYVVSVGLGGVDPDCDCDFIQLGAWLAAAEAGEETIAAIGTFVVGDISSLEDYTYAVGNSGRAAYEGTALGYVKSQYGTAAALGDLYMHYDFSDRSGAITIKNFSSHNLEFGGALDSMGASAPSFVSSTTGFNADGAFVNNGDVKGAGVIGNFSASGDEGTEGIGVWSAGGVFAGTYAGPYVPPVSPGS